RVLHFLLFGHRNHHGVFSRASLLHRSHDGVLNRLGASLGHHHGVGAGLLFSNRHPIVNSVGPRTLFGRVLGRLHGPQLGNLSRDADGLGDHGMATITATGVASIATAVRSYPTTTAAV